MNAADAFDIGSFDEDDVKGIKVRLGKSDKLTYDCLFWLQALMKCKFKPRLFSYHVFANSYGSFPLSRNEKINRKLSIQWMKSRNCDVIGDK